jgi:hypothetical protein
MENVLPEPMPDVWQNQDLILYHGTTLAFAEIIMKDGIDVEKGNPLTDFGRGFYTTSLLPQAKKWAGQLAIRKNEKAAILRYHVKREDLAKLDTLWFTSTTVELKNFWSFVFHCRMGNVGHGRSGTMVYYDVVIGPVAAKWEDQMLFADADQVSFHSKRATSILKNSELMMMEL